MMVGIQRFIDKYLGCMIVLILLPFTIFNIKPKEKRKFLLIKLWAMGDSVLTLSLIRGINETFSESTVDILLRTKVKDIYESYPHNRLYNFDSISDVMRLVCKFRSYDIVFDCEPYFNLSAILAFFLGKERVGFSHRIRSLLYTQKNKFRKDQHMVQNYLDMLRLLGKEYDNPILEKLIVDEQDIIAVNDFISKNAFGKNFVGITPGIAESSKNRMWYEERFANLADQIIDKLNCQIVFIDSIENKDIVEKVISMMKQKPINTVGKFTLKETFYLIEKCLVFVSNDTGPMHIAAAQACKTIGLFGPNTPVLWAPYGKNNLAIYKTELAPAIQNDKGVFKNGNRSGYMACISVDEVFKSVQHYVQNHK